MQLAFIIADRSNTLKRCAPFKSLQTIPYNVEGNFGWWSGVKASTVRN